MKKLVTIVILCLGCLGCPMAQNVWEPINSNNPSLGAAANGDLYAMGGYSGLLCSQDKGKTWQVVLGYETGFDRDCDWVYNNNHFYDEASGLYYKITGDNTVEVTYSDELLLTGNNSYIGDIIIPETVTYGGVTYTVTAVGAWAFYQCYDQLTSVVMPNTVITLGQEAFSGCRGLQSIHLSENLDIIGERAFENCHGLTEIEIPGTVTVLGSHAFVDCSNLVSINIPDKVGYLGDFLLAGCSNLRSVLLPEGIDTIPRGFLNGCHQLDSIRLPKSIVAIDERAFGDCYGLREMVIPDNVKTIGFCAFEGCGNLSKVELGASVAFMDEYVFNFYNGGAKLTLVCHGTIPAECYFNTFPNHVFQDMVITPCGFEDVYREAWGDYWLGGDFMEDCDFLNSEWYYEITNEDGSVTYQYLKQSGDTVVQDEPTHILVRINTLYDKGGNTEKSSEYVYERNGKVFWWNKTLGEFTVLYDYNAVAGDEWEIKVGTESLLMHVDSVELYEYEGRTYKMLEVSDSNDLFSGDIVCGIGHLTSFFPEKLINRDKGYRVEGIRCFWHEGELVFKYGDRDCDEIHEEYHDYGMDEPTIVKGFQVYPNPTDCVITVATDTYTSHQPIEYRITNLLGQTLMTGRIESEKQPIDVSALPAGMYFITFANETQKFVLKK